MKTRLTACIPNGYTVAVATVGQNIERIREQRSLSQWELADALDIRQPAVSKLEHQKGLPRLPTLFKLAKALQCSVDDLVLNVDVDYDAIVASLPPRTAGTQHLVAVSGPTLEEVAEVLGRVVPKLVTNHEWWPEVEALISDAHSDQTPPVKNVSRGDKKTIRK